MSKFKVGDIVNVIYDFDKIVKGKVIDFNQATLVYDIEILESNDVFIIGQLYKTHEDYLKKIESKEVKQVLQAKPSNDFIYFQDQDVILSKSFLKDKVISIDIKSTIKDKEHPWRYSVKTTDIVIKVYKDYEQAQEFIKQLADTLGSDIL